MNDLTNEPKNWPDLAIGLFERLTGGGAEICLTSAILKSRFLALQEETRSMLFGESTEY
ncbi:MAG: hypothetical protein K2X93_05720 [Candidatus Obscuribacterales bacterium]|nr:hypothetical protein [Candidatus Obscuribacterales bacterium]